MADNIRSEKLVPLLGVLTAVLFLAGDFLSQSSDKYADPHGMEIMKDHAGRNLAAAATSAFFCVAMVFFASAVRQALRRPDGTDTTWTTALFGGGVLVAGSGALNAWLGFALFDAADHDDRAAFQTLSYLNIDGWLPWVTGSAVFYLAAGIAALSSTVVPRWFAIVTVVLGVGCLLGPVGIAVYMATPFWLVAAGILIARRQPAERVVPADKVSV